MPIIASSLFGAGQYIVVLGILNYVVDSYQSYSASALAGVILIRNVVGAGFVSLFVQYDRNLADSCIAAAVWEADVHDTRL